MRIRLDHWHRQCGDKCCDWWGTDIYINEKKIDREYSGDDTVTILEDVLKHLKINAEVEESYGED